MTAQRILYRGDQCSLIVLSPIETLSLEVNGCPAIGDPLSMSILLRPEEVRLRKLRKCILRNTAVINHAIDSDTTYISQELVIMPDRRREKSQGLWFGYSSFRQLCHCGYHVNFCMESA